MRYSTLLSTLLFASLAGNGYHLYQRYFGADRGVLCTAAADQPVVMRTRGGLLEVSRIKATETYESSREHGILGIDVGNTVTRIRVPSVTRYTIALAPEWRIELHNQHFVVIAPAVKPSLPVGIDTAGIQKEAFGVWSVFTGTAELDQLQRSLSAALASKASSPRYIGLQRSAARQTVAGFVGKWLITQQRWKAAANYPIDVYFDDEPIGVLRDGPAPLVIR